MTINRDKQLFRFVHASDLHYEFGSVPEIPAANERILCLLRDIRCLNETQSLDFIIFSGDITHKGSACENELSEAKKLYDSLDIPYYTVAGNHDLAPHRAFAARYPGKEDYHDGIMDTSFYARIFGPRGLRFRFEKNNYTFIGISLRNDPNDGVLDWLEQELAQIRKKVILIAHYGLYPPRNSGPLLEWGFARIALLLPRLRQIVDNAGQKIILFLYGHNHINSVVIRKGVYHISGGGIQRGCTGYRLFECYKDRIDTSFHLLSDKSLHSFQYWGSDSPDTCIDANHKTSEEYHRGSKEEQFFTIIT